MTKQELMPQADDLADLVHLKTMDITSLDKVTGGLRIVRGPTVAELAEIREMIEKWEHYPVFATDFEFLVEFISEEQHRLRQLAS